MHRYQYYIIQKRNRKQMPNLLELKSSQSQRSTTFCTGPTQKPQHNAGPKCPHRWRLLCPGDLPSNESFSTGLWGSGRHPSVLWSFGWPTVLLGPWPPSEGLPPSDLMGLPPTPSRLTSLHRRMKTWLVLMNKGCHWLTGLKYPQICCTCKHASSHCQ